MLLSYSKPQGVPQGLHWTYPEDVFDYMTINEIEKVYFSPDDNFFTGLSEKDFQTFSRELFDDIMKLARSKPGYSSGIVETIEMVHNGHEYRIEVYESEPSPADAYDTLYTITINAKKV